MCRARRWQSPLGRVAKTEKGVGSLCPISVSGSRHAAVHGLSGVDVCTLFTCLLPGRESADKGSDDVCHICEIGYPPALYGCVRTLGKHKGLPAHVVHQPEGSGHCWIGNGEGVVCPVMCFLDLTSFSEKYMAQCYLL